eukprot:2353195-Karenia_brevis.AAC.1
MKQKNDDESSWKQICQVKVGCFKTEKEAVAFMKVIAEEYVANKIQSDQLYARRDELLASQNVLEQSAQSSIVK